MSKHGKASKIIVLKHHKGTGSEHEDCYETFKKLVRNSDYSKPDNFKKMAKILGFLRTNTCTGVS